MNSPRERFSVAFFPASPTPQPPSKHVVLIDVYWETRNLLTRSSNRRISRRKPFRGTIAGVAELAFISQTSFLSFLDTRVNDIVLPFFLQLKEPVTEFWPMESEQKWCVLTASGPGAFHLHGHGPPFSFHACQLDADWHSNLGNYIWKMTTPQDGRSLGP